jgi:hypothetical protein
LAALETIFGLYQFATFQLPTLDTPTITVSMLGKYSFAGGNQTQVYSFQMKELLIVGY